MPAKSTTRTSRTPTPTAFARQLRAAREHSEMGLDEVSVRVRDLIGPTWGTSRETLRRLEDGTIPESKADPLIVLALAELYGIPVAKLSTVVAEKLSKVTLFLNSSRMAARMKEPARPRRRSSATCSDAA